MNTQVSPAVRAFLEVPRFAVLGTINDDGSPQMTVLWYELQNGEILMNTSAGRKKERNLRRDARAAVTIEHGYRYATFYGTVTLIDDPDVALGDARHLAIRYRGQDEGQQMYDDVFSKQPRISLRLRIERMDIYGFDE
jgi:PPOX class probable F420-dependent enzyme